MKLSHAAAAMALSLAITSLPAAAQPADAPAQSAPIAPDRLDAARVTIAAVFPDGTYARLMDRTMESIMDSVMGSVGALPLKDLMASTGMSDEYLERMGQGTLEQMMEIIDPAYEERMEITMQTMTEQMSGLMTQFEPAFQDGLARAYARRFDTRQLAELNAFFATPTGADYARESMLLYTDPEVMGKMREIMPAMMKQMPQIMAAMTEATAHLPKPRSADELSPAERKKLDELVGVPAGQPEED